MENVKQPNGASPDAAVQEVVRVDQPVTPTKARRRMRFVDVCSCGEVLPHAFACCFTTDPEICS